MSGRPAPAEGQGDAGRRVHGGPRRLGPAAAAARATRARSSAATPSCASWSPCSTRRPPTAAAGWRRCSASRGSARAASPGSWSVPSASAPPRVEWQTGGAPGIRRRHRLRRRGRDGPPPLPDRRARGGGGRAAAACRRRWRSCSATRRTGPGSSRGWRCSLDPGVAAALRARGAVRGLAALLRAARRRRADGARVRGPPMGRCGAARLHRAPRDVDARPPDPRPHPRPTRSSSTRGRPGAPAQRSFTALRLDRLPDARDARAARRARARHPGGCSPPHPRSRRWRAALRGRADPDAPSTAGQLVPIDGGYRLAGPLADADLPDSLHRPACRSPRRACRRRDRSVLRSAAVLGRRFSPEALARRHRHRARPSCDARIASLVDREMLAYDDELRSPVSGQVAFVQDLVRELAYRTLSRGERQAAHLAGGRRTSRRVGDEELRRGDRPRTSRPRTPPIRRTPMRAIDRGAGRTLLRQAARRALSVHAPGARPRRPRPALAMPVDGRRARRPDRGRGERGAPCGPVSSVAEAHLRELVAAVPARAAATTAATATVPSLPASS